MRISSGSSHVNLAHDCWRAMPARRLPHQQLERVAPQALLRQRSGAAAAADGEDAASAMGAPRAWRRGAPKALEAGGRKVTGRKPGILYWIGALACLPAVHIRQAGCTYVVGKERSTVIKPERTSH